MAAPREARITQTGRRSNGLNHTSLGAMVCEIESYRRQLFR
jgi:hypothetical protein